MIKKLFLFFIVFFVAVSVIAITPQNNFNFRDYYNLTNINNLSSSTANVGGFPVCTSGNGLCLVALDLDAIVGNIGNWSADKSKYYNTTQIDTLGNWSAEKSQYWNTSQSYNTTQIDTLGNWSADKSKYFNATDQIYIYNVSGNITFNETKLNDSITAQLINYSSALALDEYIKNDTNANLTDLVVFGNLSHYQQAVMVNGITRAVMYFDGNKNVTKVEIFNDGNVADYSDASTVGSIQWAIEQIKNNSGLVSIHPGKYALANPIVIDYDWITIEGTVKPHWNDWTGVYPALATPGNPGGAQLVASGESAIRIGTTAANMHGDTRHKAIAIRDLYLYGQSIAKWGIYDTLNSDLMEVKGNLIQGFELAGINESWDYSQIMDNNIQSNNGWCIHVGTNMTYYSIISNNICYDGGNGILLNTSGWTTGFGHIISNNVIGRVTTAIQIDTGVCLIYGNSIDTVTNSIVDNYKKCIIYGNQIEKTNIVDFYDETIKTSANITSGVINSSNATFNRVTIVGSLSVTGASISFVNGSTRNWTVTQQLHAQNFSVGNITVRGTIDLSNLSAGNITIQEQLSAANITAGNITAQNIYTRNITAINITAQSIYAGNITATILNITGDLIGNNVTFQNYIDMYNQTVIVAKRGGDYTTIQEAIDSITDATTNKRYVVLIYPGVYIENITGKAYVFLVGYGKGMGTGATIFSYGGATYTSPVGLNGISNMLLIQNDTVGSSDVIRASGAGSVLGLIDCRITYTSNINGGSGLGINMSSGAVVVFNGGQISYTTTGSAAGIKNQTFILNNNANLDLYGTQVTGQISDIDDTVAIVSEREVPISSTTRLSTNNFELYMKNESYAGNATFYKAVTNQVIKTIFGNLIKINSSSAKGRGCIYLINTSKGNSSVRSISNRGLVEGFQLNYYFCSNQTDQLVSDFDVLDVDNRISQLGLNVTGVWTEREGYLTVQENVTTNVLSVNSGTATNFNITSMYGSSIRLLDKNESLLLYGGDSSSVPYGGVTFQRTYNTTTTMLNVIPTFQGNPSYGAVTNPSAEIDGRAIAGYVLPNGKTGYIARARVTGLSYGAYWYQVNGGGGNLTTRGAFIFGGGAYGGQMNVSNSYGIIAAGSLTGDFGGFGGTEIQVQNHTYSFYAQPFDSVTGATSYLNAEQVARIGKPINTYRDTRAGGKQLVLEGNGSSSGIWFNVNNPDFNESRWARIYSPANSSLAFALDNGTYEKWIMNITYDNVAFNSSVTIGKNLTVSQNLSVTGSSRFIGEMNISGNLSFFLPYANLVDNRTQTMASTTASQPINFSDITDGNMYNLTNRNINISFSTSGDYLVTFSALMRCTTGANNDVEVWIRKNGNNVELSNTRLTASTANQYYLMTVTFIIDLRPTDKFNLEWWAASTSCSLTPIAPQASPTRPSAPSIILTANKISSDKSMG